MMSDTEEAPPPPAPLAVSAGPHAPPLPQVYNFLTNFPVPAAMVYRLGICQATMARLRSSDWFGSKESTVTVSNVPFSYGKRVAADFRNLTFGSGEVTISSALKALEDYFFPKRNVVYVNYVFNSCCQTPDKLLTVFSIN